MMQARAFGCPFAAGPATWHVPPRNPDFTGRDSLLVRVRETLLRAFPGLAVLQGLGGVGKTQLSIEYAHRYASDYDTVWVIDSEQPELITSQLAELAVAIGAAALWPMLRLRHRRRSPRYGTADDGCSSSIMSKILTSSLTSCQMGRGTCW